MLKSLTLAAALCLTTTTAALSQNYERIAVAGGDITEIIYALGAGDRIVAVDSTSGFPANTKTKAQIGYVRALSAEGVLSLSPDLLIGADDAGPPNVIDTLKSAGLAVALAPLGQGADRVPAKMRFVGETLGLRDQADALITQYTADMAKLKARVDALEHRPKVLFILSLRDGAPLVGGQETSASDIIELAGGTNAAAAFAGWKPMNAEALIAANPDFILMSGVHADNIGGDDKVMNRPDVQQTTAGKAGNLVKMDGMKLLGFGPRTAEAVAELMNHLHPIGK
ncbi:heme/hemin ABC transporter substrate-binding protein [Neptunicoccus cionae]|uniref:Hemin ABC transporter substrate-binding protein n=1 Tax=Neptunicoccus cionae TaxID=2035344 RepID=A0A916VQ62_9RHOB|nr:ABC transporter substrate-binding protein [Amylibacter cionae]GGA20078.1 hemin ABC transporter substrate-binding protein [Amylibacter cionae]